MDIRLAIVNPWSFVNWFRTRELSSYWVSTSSLETIANVLTPHIGRAMEESIAILFDNQNFRVPKHKSQVNYSDSNWETSSILHFLVHLDI
jgi:hypothetical protein